MRLKEAHFPKIPVQILPVVFNLRALVDLVCPLPSTIAHVADDADELAGLSKSSAVKLEIYVLCNNITHEIPVLNLGSKYSLHGPVHSNIDVITKIVANLQAAFDKPHVFVGLLIREVERKLAYLR